jgi:hypothetical protein
MAVAASILSIAYYLLRNQVPYHDLGALYFARADEERTAQRLARRIKELGYEVHIRKAA